VKIYKNLSYRAGTDSRSKTQRAETTALFLHCKKYLKETTEIKWIRFIQMYEEFGIKLYTKNFNNIL